MEGITNHRIECWKQIIIDGNTFPYEISDLGTIRRTKSSSKGHAIGRILKPSKDKDGYLISKLCRGDKKIHYFKLHHLVLTLFKGPRMNREGNHIDNNKTNNSVENLEWCTPHENMIHSYKTKRKHWATL